MKVTNKPTGNAPVKSTGKNEAASNAKKTGGAKSDVKLENLGTAGSAKVDVSDRAQMMQKSKEIASDSRVDEAKVARLQKLIDDGKYKVDADKIADKLVDEHLLIPD